MPTNTPRVILHIGFHKTGSTALQCFFAVNELLLRSRGVYFPRAGRGRETDRIIHSNIAWQLTGHGSFDQSLGTLGELVDEVGSYSGTHIVSTEGFSRLDDPDKLLSAFEHCRIQVVAYQRDPLHAAPSFYTEQLKSGTAKTWEDWADDFTLDRWFNYERRLSLWRRPHVTVVSRRITEERLAEDTGLNIFADFAGIIPIDYCSLGFALPGQESDNSRISLLECAVLYATNLAISASSGSLPESQKLFIRRKARRIIRRLFPGHLTPFSLHSSQKELLRTTLRRLGLLDSAAHPNPEREKENNQSSVLPDLRKLRTTIQRAFSRRFPDAFPFDVERVMEFLQLAEPDLRSSQPPRSTARQPVELKLVTLQQLAEREQAELFPHILETAQTFGGPHFAKFFQHPAPTIARVPRLYIKGGTFVGVTPTGAIPSDLTLPRMARIATDGPALSILTHPSPIKLPPTTLILGGQDNYYHWMLNWLSRISALEALGAMDKFDSVLVTEKENMPPYQTFALRHIVSLKGKRLIHARQKDVFLFENPTVAGLIPPPALFLPHLNWLRKTFLPANTESLPQHIYVSRRDAKGRRLLSNETEVAAMLESFGFTVVTLSDFTIVEQASLFASARTIISPHGASLTNLVFCSPGTNVCELQSKDRYTRMYMSLGKYAGCKKYDIIKCTPVNSSSSNVTDLHVSLSAVESAVQSFSMD